jgi:hypothetical protein
MSTFSCDIAYARSVDAGYLLLVTVHCLVAGVASTPPVTAERTLNVCWPTDRLL